MIWTQHVKDRRVYMHSGESYLPLPFPVSAQINFFLLSFQEELLSLGDHQEMANLAVSVSLSNLDTIASTMQVTEDQILQYVVKRDTMQQTGKYIHKPPKTLLTELFLNYISWQTTQGQK